MALINPQQAGANGGVITYAAATASDTFRPTDRGVLLYRTAGTASTLTIVIPGNNRHGQPNPDPAIAMAATEARAIATAPYVGDADGNGLVTITSSSQTNLTVAYVLA